jgi:hypothetical protein
MRVMNRLLRFVRPLAVLSIVVALAAACTAYRPLTRQPLPRDEIRLSFLSPRELSGRTERGGTFALGRVTELRGSIASIASDTVRVFVTAARGPNGDVSAIPPGLLVAVARDWYPTMQERHVSMKPAKTLGYVALGALALVVFAIGLALEDM